MKDISSYLKVSVIVADISKYGLNVKTACHTIRLRKTFDDIISSLDTVQECDRQTDGHRPTASTALTHSVVR